MIKRDKIEHHIVHLQEKHDVLYKEIITEENHYGNHEHIQELKKKNFVLKMKLPSSTQN